MNSRERFFTALSHKEPDRVPYNAFLCEAKENELQSLMKNGEDYRKFYQEDIMFCEFGITEEVWRKISFENLPLPSKEQIARAKAEGERLKAEGTVTCNAYVPGVYESLKQIIGDENALVLIYEDPEKLAEMIEKIGEWRCEIAKIHAENGMDICFIGDDIGAQQSLIMSLNSYREFYKPYHKKLVEVIKKANPQCKVAFHCCGYIMPLVPELIEVGVDILQTVQPEANNDLKLLKETYGNDITFWGAIGMQSVFFGHTPEYVREVVLETLKIMSANGGYIAAPCHKATEDIHIENVIAFYETMMAFGAYPRPGTK